tara:strand:+ start:327 stop:581 length:255 start_codon:yes stop_codon:yes gene_type:complete
MKRGRKYIEPITGKGDKKGTNIPDKNDKRRNEAAAEIKNMQAKDVKKGTPKVGASGKTWDGLSRPSNDLYRESFKRIFGENNEK